MRFIRPYINNKEDAIRIAAPYIDACKFKTKDIITASMNFPKQAISSRWQMTHEALETTLSYIFDHLGHQCYMLCISDSEGKRKSDSDGKSETIGKEMLLYKLISNDLAAPVREKLETNIKNIRKNKTLNDEQQRIISKLINTTPKKHLRLLQCILKLQDGRAVDEPENYKPEHAVFMETLDLPCGVYILNLTDAVILKKDYTEALPIYPKGQRLPEIYYEKPFLPIFSLSGQTGYADITIPNYDDIALTSGELPNTYTTIWEEKTLPGAVFRGGPSGCGYTSETNQRIALAALSNTINDPTILDAGIVSVKSTIDSKSMKYDPKYGLGMMNTGMAAVPRITMENQSKHKYIVHVDGNVNAYRLLATMMTGSLILRVDSEYKSWADQYLKHNEHYILVRPDLSDLVEKITWAKSHDSKARKIAESGAALAAQLTQINFMKSYIENLFWTVSNKIHGALPKIKNKTRKIKEPELIIEKEPELIIKKEQEKEPEKEKEKEPEKEKEKEPEKENENEKEKEKEKEPEDTELLNALRALQDNEKEKKPESEIKPTKPTGPPPSTRRNQRRYKEEKKGGKTRKHKRIIYRKI